MTNVNTTDWTNGLAWTPELETGYEDIDNQHRQLFKLLSDLIESFQRNDNKVTIKETLLFLAGYTVKHFSDEEKIAVRYKYPKHNEHKKMHEEFTQTVIGFVDQYEKDGDSEILFAAVRKVIIRWLIKHIRGEDYKIAQHIKSITSAN